MNNVTTTILIDKRVKTKAQTYAIKLRLTEFRVQKYYPLGYRMTVDEWNKTQDPKAKGKHKDLKMYFTKTEEKALSIIRNLDEFTFRDFEKQFLNIPQSKIDLFQLFQDYIDTLRKEQRHGTAFSYRDAQSSFCKYSIKHLKQKKVLLRDITKDWLQNYEIHKLEQGMSPSTIGIYMRSLRAVINLAIENGSYNKDNYPFGKRKYIIPSTRNVKKALNIEDIKRFIEYQTTDPDELKFRDMWLFSYLANGINMKDICLLKYKNVGKDYISFIRSKTSRSTKNNQKPIIIPILPELLQIINKWGNESRKPDSYIFDILSDKDTPLDVTNKVKQFTKSVNVRTKRIGKDLGFELVMTTYVARHSYATVMKRSGAPIELICENLGHKNLSTTENYLDSFESDTQMKYQKNLLNF